MKKVIFITVFLVLGVLTMEKCTVSKRPAKFDGLETKSQGFYDLKAELINGDIASFESYKGKKVLIVNTASKCGFTPQYDGLQKLYDKNKENLVILGFPSNQFGAQEPGSNKEVAEFCRLNYGVEFPMFEKVDVKGDQQHPVFKWLSNPEQNGWNKDVPGWNFSKYMVDENGQLIRFFNSFVSPDSNEIKDALK